MFYEELFDSSVTLMQDKRSSDTLAAIPACKGVLLFADNQHQPIQLLISANIRRLIANRLERLAEKQPSRQSNTVKIASFVYYKQTYNDFESRLFYNFSARHCFPDTYCDWIDLPKPDFVILDETDKCPCFRLAEKPKLYTSKNLHIYGLFPNRKTADHYCHALNTVHALCRNPLIACTKKAKTCNYFQMDLCSGFCMGKISKQTYFQHVKKAIHFSSNLKPSNYIDQLKPQMAHFGRIQEYEKAQKIKEKVELLQSLDTTAYDWTGPLHGMDIFHIDLSEKIEIQGHRAKCQTYDLFRISWNSIYIMKNVLPANLESAMQKILMEPDCIIAYNKEDIMEHIGIVSRFIYRKKNNGLWVNQSRKKQIKDLLNKIYETFPQILKCLEKKDAEASSAS